MKKILIIIFCILFTAGIIFNYSTIRNSVVASVSLCVTSVLPTVFPFMIITSVIVSSGSAEIIGRPFAPLLKKIFGVSSCSTAPILLGLTAGFPIGALCSYKLYKKGDIDKEEAEYLLSFCSNSGISFIFGIMGGAVFGSIKAGVIIFLIQTVASVLCGVILRRKDNVQSYINYSKYNISVSNVIIDSVKSSVLNIAYICGYIIFFAVLTELVLSVLPSYCRLPLKGVLELTGASYELINIPYKPAFIVACGLLSWSGVCVHMQVRSVVGELSLKPYFLGKIIHMAISMTLASLIPIENYVNAYRESSFVSVNHTSYGLMFAAIIFIIYCCIFFKNSVK